MIDIVPYDPAWPLAFARERDRLAAALGDSALRIEHNGSTSVPGLAAKPIIDIQISVERLHPIDAYAPALAALGYTHRPHPDDAFCPFFYQPAEGRHTHHVHVVEAGGEEERRTLAFRDALRQNPRLASEYAALKRTLAVTHASSVDAYAEAKSGFLERVISRLGV